MTVCNALPLESLVLALVTILVVVDRSAWCPLHCGHPGLPPKSRRNVALRACLIAMAILAGAALAGDWLLRTLSITLPA